jgi:hypothetical protein
MLGIYYILRDSNVGDTRVLEYCIRNVDIEFFFLEYRYEYTSGTKTGVWKLIKIYSSSVFQRYTLIKSKKSNVY